MLDLLAAAKIAGIVASGYALVTVYRSMPEPAVRRKLRKTFEAGGIYTKQTKKRGKERVEVIRFPTIQRVSALQDYTEAVFTLPQGIDPEAVLAKEWLFRQGFGEYVELSGDSKTVVMRAYRSDMSTFSYDLEEASRATKDMRVPIFVGRSRRGPIAVDMVEMPHLLNTGMTGGGKSVWLRSALVTLLELAGDRVELYCADLKRSEFGMFRGVARRVDVEPADLLQTLFVIERQLEERGRAQDRAGVQQLHELPERERPPYIVLAIDEVALLKGKAYAEHMRIIERIGFIGRSLGVFLILSMQRADADVLAGSLKVNLSVRLSFRQPDEINSRIAVGSGAASRIKPTQRGRMVYHNGDHMYVQAPYLEASTAKEMLSKMERVEEEPPAAQETPQEDDSDEILIGVL